MPSWPMSPQFTDAKYDLVYFTECHLATVCGYAMKKSTPKSELTRFVGLAANMLYRLSMLKVTVAELEATAHGANREAYKCTRVSALLAKFEQPGEQSQERMLAIVTEWAASFKR